MVTRFLRNLFTVAIAALCLVTAGSPRLATAQNVEWMSADQAAQLDLGFTVLAPSWVPAPFGGSPSIQASGGYYSLYWMNGGGAPTFLQITGEVGGSLPAGSPADLNNQLFINATVQGYEAIHDVTSIYDNVWWIAGGVLYMVSSNNMTGVDSLSLANSLIALEAPEYVPPTEEPTEVATEEPTEIVTEVPTESPTESATEPPTEVATEQPVEIDDGTGGSLESVSTQESGQETSVSTTSGESGSAVEPTPMQAEAGTADGTGGGDLADDLDTTVSTETAGVSQSPSSGGVNGELLSDGTAGPQLPPGSDGTGGIRQIVLP